MNKIILIMICIIVVIGAIFTAVIIFNDNQKNQENVETKIASENILDECTDEYEVIKQTETIETDSDEIKTSPNCSVILKKHYTKCGHTVTEYINLPNDVVNATKDVIQDVYQGWNIDSFKSNEIILSRNIDSECGEHYIIKDDNGKVTIYRILENSTEELVEQTDISTDYLTETDKINMQNGIRANGKQELNQLIEDFE